MKQIGKSFNILGSGGFFELGVSGSTLYNVETTSALGNRIDRTTTYTPDGTVRNIVETIVPLTSETLLPSPLEIDFLSNGNIAVLATGVDPFVRSSTAQVAP